MNIVVAPKRNKQAGLGGPGAAKPRRPTRTGAGDATLLATASSGEYAATSDGMTPPRPPRTNGAKAYYLEHTTGSIEVGKSANLVVVDQNLFNISPDQLFERSGAAHHVPRQHTVQRWRLLRAAGRMSLRQGAAGASSTRRPNPLSRPLD